MSEPQELEKNAKEFVSAAVELENRGENQQAITFYQKAIDNLNQLVQRYPNYGFSEIYKDRLDTYRARIKTLQTAITAPKPPEQSESKPDLAAILQEINQKIDSLTDSVAELKDEVATIKLNVNDVVGKTEQAHKEVAEIRGLVYAIKYER